MGIQLVYPTMPQSMIYPSFRGSQNAQKYQMVFHLKRVAAPNIQI